MIQSIEQACSKVNYCGKTYWYFISLLIIHLQSNTKSCKHEELSYKVIQQVAVSVAGVLRVDGNF